MRHSIPIENLCESYNQKAQSLLLSPVVGKQIKLFQIKLLNRSGDFCSIGIFRKLADAGRSVYYYNGTTATNITSRINAGTASQINDTTVGTSLVVQAKRKFGLVGIVVSTASTGSPTFTANYFNGTAFIPLPDIIETVSFGATGYTLLVFSAPLDWVPGGLAGTDQTLYTVKIDTATAGSAAQATSVQVASMLDFAPFVNTNSGLEQSWSVDYPIHLEANEGLLPYFSNPSDKNLVTAFYSQDN